MRSAGPVVALALGACAPGDDAVDGDPRHPELVAGDAVLRLDADRGRFSIRADDGRVVLLGGTAGATLDALGDAGRALSLDDGPLEVARGTVETALGHGEALTARRVDDAGPDLVWEAVAYDDGAFTFRISVDNDTDGDVVVARLSPVTLATGGLLAVGDGPVTNRILDDGAFTAIDFVSEVHLGAEGPSSWSGLLPGDFRGHVTSNWNHAIGDLPTGAAWIAGALTYELAFTELGTSFDEFAPTRTEDGRQGYGWLGIENALLPLAKVLPPGAALASELVRVEPGAGDVIGGLERHAAAVATWNDVTVWHRRPGNAVPNGWNSWTASGSSGGYGQDIDEDVVLANLDVMRRELHAFGMDWFQVDDGWQVRTGDWTWDARKFPHGARWLTDRIHDAGFRTGLWMAPFIADATSDLAAAHPDWFAHRLPLGTLVGGNRPILDLTHPEVRAWLRSTMRTLRQDWGFDWLKLDFGYYAMFGDQLSDPGATREEAWRGAVRAVRDGLGDDAFLLTIGAMGVNFGLADGSRLTLDNMPVWDRRPSDPPDFALQQQGLKPAVRTVSRRWYLHGRVWENHPDLILFRSNTNDPSWPRLTFEESRAFATFVGLSGGIVKLGDRLVDLRPDELDVVRRLLPTYGEAAAPLDVLRREFPEVHRVEVVPKDGFDQRFTVVGLFDWGANADLSTSPFTPIPDGAGPHRFDLALADLGVTGPVDAWEFWTGTYLGRLDARLVVDVPAHDVRVVALRPASDDPAFLGWNRQLSMGGRLVHEVTWDADAGELTAVVDVAAAEGGRPFEHELDFRIPEALTVGDVVVDGVAVHGLEHVREGVVLRIRFVPDGSGAAIVRIGLDASG